MAYTQQNRAMQIATPLGENVLLLTGLRGAEAISRPFRFDLDLISSEARHRISIRSWVNP